MSAPNPLHRTLGRYQLLISVARGGMGQVWLGRLRGARGFNKLVAIKTLLPNEEERGKLELMLAEEARLASLIQHANVVHTLELGEHEGLLYLVMDWVDGEPLGFVVERAQQRGGFPFAVAVQLVGQVLAGLHAAHELCDESGPLGVVHRDVSPHNILVTYDGVAKLVDFGIAKATRQTTQQTHHGEIKGKFSYMAPEQILGAALDRRVDVFAAGIVLYLLTTGRHPFKHHNAAATIHAITKDEPVAPPSTLMEEFPTELEAVLVKALEKDVEKRFSTAEEMRAALVEAMPEAFGDTGRRELEAFMEQTIGDRRIARREAVRRAQLAADASDAETGSRGSLQGSAQSASSLRAISISQPSAEDVPELLNPSEATPAEPPVPQIERVSKAPYIAAVAGLSLAVAVSAPRWLGSHGAPTIGGATGIEAGAPIASAVSAALSPATSVFPTPPSPREADGAERVPAPASSTPTAPVRVPSASKPKLHAPRAPAKAKSTAVSSPAPASQQDLMPPDYAR